MGLPPAVAALAAAASLPGATGHALFYRRAQRTVLVGEPLDGLLVACVEVPESMPRAGCLRGATSEIRMVTPHE